VASNLCSEAKRKTKLHNARTSLKSRFLSKRELEPRRLLRLYVLAKAVLSRIFNSTTISRFTGQSKIKLLPGEEWKTASSCLTPSTEVTCNAFLRKKWLNLK